jgi:hypothetical protein
MTRPLPNSCHTISGRSVATHGGLLWIDANFVGSGAGQGSVVVASTCASACALTRIPYPDVNAGYFPSNSAKYGRPASVGAR